MVDVLSGVRNDLEKRLRELEPFIKEHVQVRAALDALTGAGARVRVDSPTNVVRRQRAARTASSAAPTRGRPRGTGARAQEALKLVHRQPGITIAEMAKRMKIKPNYLYRVLPGLVKSGQIHKRNKGYHPTEK